MLRFILPLVLLAATAACDAPARASEAHAVVFMYHRFGDSRYPSTNITMAQFERQLDYLAQNGYRIWPLARIVEHLESDRAIPNRTVALTVDDAYRSVYEKAYPLLRSRKVPVTVFVSTDAVDRASPEHMSWAQMRRMGASGLVHFANHGASHDHLALRRPGESHRQWEERVSGDVLKAQARLDEELGRRRPTARLFAYPYGEYSSALAGLVESLGFTAFGQHSGAIGSRSDRRALPRYPMAEAFADPVEFAVKAASLPLPVIEQTPRDPLTAANPPRFRFTVAPGPVGLNELACYAAGQGRMTLERHGPRTFSVQAHKPLSPGRSRYNCTAPHERENRFFWFSQPWLIETPAQTASPGARMRILQPRSSDQ